MRKQLLTKMLLAVAGLLMGTSMWAVDEYTTVYQRNTTFGNANIWVDADKTAWANESKLTVDVKTSAEDETSRHGLYFNGLTDNGSFSAKKTFSIEDNAKVKYEATWYFGGATSNGYLYIQFGDKIRLGYNTSYKVYLSTDGGTTYGSTAYLDNGSSASGTMRAIPIVIIFDTSTGTVESFTFNGVDKKSDVSGTFTGDFDYIQFGFVKSSKTIYSKTSGIVDLTVSQCEQEVTEADYTINYQLSGTTVKTVSSKGNVGLKITADAAIDGTEEGYVGNHYLITAAEAPEMTLVSDAASNVLNVPVRAPYTATLSVTKKIGGVAQTPVVTDLTETDDKVCSWTYTYDKYVYYNSKFYVADVTSSYGESGSFSNGETISKTVNYTNEDASVMAYTEMGTGGTNTALSGGATGSNNNELASCTLEAGCYVAEIYVVSKAGSGSHTRNEGVWVNGSSVISTPEDTYGLISLPFTINVDETPVYVKGIASGSSYNSDNLDYVLIRKVTTIPVTISAVDYSTLASDYDLDFSKLTSSVKAYRATVSGSTITFTRVDQVPAGEGVLLKSVADLEANTVFNIPVTTGVTPWANDANAFVRGTGTAVATGSGPYNYVLSTKSGVVGFYQANDQIVPANKAYLQSTTNAARVALIFDDDATGIGSVSSEETRVNSDIYDLQGRRVVLPAKGLYIVNGKKVIVK